MHMFVGIPSPAVLTMAALGLCLASPAAAGSPPSPSPSPSAPTAAADLGSQTDKLRVLCASGELEACNKIAAGDVLGNGEEPPDPARGMALATFTCDKGDAGGCFLVAVAYCEGRGVPRNAKAAAPFAKRACDGDAPQACAPGADVCGHIVSLFVRAQERRVAACADTSERGDARGVECLNAARTYETGAPGVPKDPRRADDYFKRACSFGVTDGKRPPCPVPSP